MQPVALTQGLRDFYNSLGNTPGSREAEGQLNQFNKMTPRSADILKAYEEQAGVGGYESQASDLRKSILNTEGLINAVDDSVRSRTSNALVSEAQAQRLIGAERDPLTTQLGTISRRYETTTADAATAREKAGRYASLDIGDISTWTGSLEKRLQSALTREAEERARAEQARQMKALQDMIAAQNAENARRMNELSRLTAQANQRSQWLTSQSSRLLQPASINLQGSSYNPQPAYNPQRAGGGNIQGGAINLNNLTGRIGSVGVARPTANVSVARPAPTPNLVMARPTAQPKLSVGTARNTGTIRVGR